VINPRSPAGSPSANAAVLRPLFVRHVHELLYRGYERLSASAYCTAQEEQITGDLKSEIDKVLDERPKRWMIHYFSAEETPVSDGTTKGKRRRKIDIQVTSSRFAPRARFSFEAKRLGRRHPVSIYLGTAGLGRFLCGDYASESDEAGMLGYVQSGSLDDWSTRLAADFGSKATELGADSAGIKAQQVIDQLPNSFWSIHRRSSLNRMIRIYHTLLLFH